MYNVEIKSLTKLGIRLRPKHELKTSSEEDAPLFNVLLAMYEMQEVFPEICKFSAIVDGLPCSIWYGMVVV